MAGTTSQEPQALQQGAQRFFFQEMEWNDVHTPGAYIDASTGDLIQVPQQAIGPASPLMSRVSTQNRQLVKLADNPYITLIEARRLCVLANINPNF
jgi:hypothetical protein